MKPELADLINNGAYSPSKHVDKFQKVAFRETAIILLSKSLLGHLVLKMAMTAPLP
jgi:hypothetical protein